MSGSLFSWRLWVQQGQVRHRSRRNSSQAAGSGTCSRRDCWELGRRYQSWQWLVSVACTMPVLMAQQQQQQQCKQQPLYSWALPVLRHSSSASTICTIAYCHVQMEAALGSQAAVPMHL